MNLKKIVEDLIDTFLTAGTLSLKLRDNGLTKEIKSDNTPVTNGDIEINRLISEKISQITPDIPIISEESSKNKNIKNLKDFWLIDPIDGTYNYLNNLEEFTINAGLIINNKPVAGLIYAPAKMRMFYSYGKGKAFERSNGKIINLSNLNLKKNDTLTFVSYSDKIKPEIKKIYDKIGVKKNIKIKSSFKFCVIASGEFDGYVAEPRAYEWDIAAGHAIVNGVGGSVTDFENNEILYGKKNFENSSLIIKSKKIK